MSKIDFIKANKKLYSPGAEPELVDVPTMHFLMFDGHGHPENNPQFQHAFQILYGIAYGLKFLPKHGIAPKEYEDFRMPPAEGLWWVAGDKPFNEAKLEDWRWTLMLRVPAWVKSKQVEAVASELAAKKDDELYMKARLKKLNEGMAVQLMHFGPYETEPEDIDRLSAYAKFKNLNYAGKFHEIYFGDPRRTLPERLRTLVRFPVKAV